MEFDGWITQLAKALELNEAVVDVDAQLDLARDAAHTIERRAAPITAFMVGLAAGRDGGDAATIDRIVSQVSALLRA